MTSELTKMFWGISKALWFKRWFLYIWRLLYEIFGLIMFFEVKMVVDKEVCFRCEYCLSAGWLQHDRQERLECIECQFSGNSGEISRAIWNLTMR